MSDLNTIISIALSNKNAGAWLRVVRAGESRQDDSAYSEIYGGSFVADLSDHPFRHLPHIRLPNGQTTSAAGAYQAEIGTWTDFTRATGPSDFSPPRQDAFAIWCTWRRGALDDVLAGRIEKALAKCRLEWASLTPARDQKSLAVFQQFGGVLDRASTPTQARPSGTAPEPIAPGAIPVHKDESHPMPLLAALLPSVLALFAPRAQAAIQKVTDQPADVVAPFLQSLFAKIQEVTGKDDPVQATAALQSAPADQVAAVQEDALAYLDKLAPILDKLSGYDKDAWAASEASVSAAAQRGKDMSEGPLWRNPTFIVALLVLAMVGYVVYIVLGKGGFSTDMQAFVIGAIVGSALTAVLGFFFGSSRSSSAKDVLIGEMARRGNAG